MSDLILSRAVKRREPKDALFPVQSEPALMRNAGTAVLLAGMIAIMPPAVSAQSLDARLRNFGLLGTWAPDCGEAPSPLHPQAIYAAEPSGTVSMSYEPGASAPRSAYAILDAQRIGDDKLLLQEEWLHDHSRLEVTLRKFRGKVKVWLSRESIGRVLVRDGTVLATGYVSPWMMRCSG
ncbi:MAG: hypothetical protein ACREFI_19050 [Stellaceae bacterium]